MSENQVPLEYQGNTLRRFLEAFNVCSIPSEWQVRVLDTVAKRGSGHTPEKQIPEYWNGGIKWVSLADSDKLDHRFIYETDKEISQEGINHSSAVLHPAGTVILSRDAGVGKSAIIGSEMAVSQHFIAWQCGPELNNDFLYYWLQFFKPEFERIAVGSTIKTIGLPYFKKLEILLPPLTEQRKIATILSAWDKAIDLTERLIAILQARKKVIMQHLFSGDMRFTEFKDSNQCRQTRYGLRPSEWRPTLIKDVTLEHKQGFYTNKGYVQNGNTKLLRITDLKNPVIDYENAPELEISEKEFDQFKVLEGDFLIARSGAIGRYGICKNDTRSIFGSFIIRFRFDQDKMLNQYFGGLLETQFVKHQLELITQGSSNQNINAENIKSLIVYLPEIAEQKRIVEILETCNEEIGLNYRKLDALNQQKKGLMQRLLTGEVRVKV